MDYKNYSSRDKNENGVTSGTIVIFLSFFKTYKQVQMIGFSF